ncbi:unnamed protein product [Bathycoccus prasinos]
MMLLPSGDHEKAELTSSPSLRKESCSISPVVASTKCNWNDAFSSRSKMQTTFESAGFARGQNRTEP